MISWVLFYFAPVFFPSPLLALITNGNCLIYFSSPLSTSSQTYYIYTRGSRPPYISRSVRIFRLHLTMECGQPSQLMALTHFLTVISVCESILQKCVPVWEYTLHIYTQTEHVYYNIVYIYRYTQKCTYCSTCGSIHPWRINYGAWPLWLSPDLLSNASHASIKQDKLAVDRRCLPHLGNDIWQSQVFPLQSSLCSTTSTQGNLSLFHQAHTGAGTSTCSCCGTVTTTKGRNP